MGLGLINDRWLNLALNWTGLQMDEKHDTAARLTPNDITRARKECLYLQYFGMIFFCKTGQSGDTSIFNNVNCLDYICAVRPAAA